MGRKPKENTNLNPETKPANVHLDFQADTKEQEISQTDVKEQEIPQFVSDAFRVFPEYKELYISAKGIYTSPYGDAKLYKNPFIN